MLWGGGSKCQLNTAPPQKAEATRFKAPTHSHFQPAARSPNTPPHSGRGT